MSGFSSKRKRTPSEGPLVGADQQKLHNNDLVRPHEPKQMDSEVRPKKKEKTQSISAGEHPVPLPPTSRRLRTVGPWRLALACGTVSADHCHPVRDITRVVEQTDSQTPLHAYQRSLLIKAQVDQLGGRLRKQNKPSQMHNLAFPGATAQDDLSDQLSHFFTLFPKKDIANADWTTYIVFLGINDCGSNDADELESIVENVFDAVHNLYVKAGARNFVLVDVPPIDRSPQASASESSDEIEERVKTWNELLLAQASEFGTSYEEATMLLFSSYNVLEEVLDDPAEFDFDEEDTTAEGGTIWEDDLHLTADMHDILAERLLASLSLCLKDVWRKDKDISSDPPHRYRYP
ncbi:hypothetical protein C8Q74DRAFT_1218730 [Fomes fomentarius]|nr:hypothetical protein C8Q74DRAFT_1218730 [Fomes fomentarius]